MSYFWKKKIIVTYFLSVLVLLIHISAFVNYTFDDSVVAKALVFFVTFVQRVFSQMAVPLFFIISGALFFRNYTNENYFQKLKSRFFSLVIPYLVWNVLNMLFAIATSYTFISDYFIGREKFILNIRNIFSAIFLYSTNGPFWFVFCLIVFVAISPLFEMVLRKKWIGGGAVYSY